MAPSTDTKRVSRTRNDLPADTRTEMIALCNAMLADCIDLETQTISGPGGPDIKFDIPDSDRTRLLEGLDDIGMTLKHTDDIKAFEKRMAASQPWLQTATDSRL